METPNKEAELSSSPEQSMAASGPPSPGEESNADSSSDIIIMQSEESIINALIAFGMITMQNTEGQAGEYHHQDLPQNTQSQPARTGITVDTQAASSNNPTPLPYKTRRARRRGRTFDQGHLAYNIANPPPRVSRRRYRSMSEMDCPLGRGFIESSSTAPPVVNFLMEAPGFWDMESSRFCLRCGSDHF